MKGIRLNDFAVKTICETFRKTFLDEDHLWLFGSRADLSMQGGDIDLYVETTLQPFEKALDAKNRFFVSLIRNLGDQKIDITINNGSSKKLIYDIATTEGVQLL